jgi:protein ImuB
MCVWLPNWPIQRRVSLRFERDARPLVLFSESARSLQIAACSAAAAARGIHPGISLAEARGLCEGSYHENSAPTPLIAEPTDPSTDRAALQQLARQCQTYSPIVGLEESETPESLLLDITGCETHFGGEQALAQHLWNEFSSCGYHARIAITDTVGASWAIAHFGVFANNPITVIPEDEHVSSVRALPVAGLRLDPRLLAILNKLDLRNIGQVERLPRTTLPARFGKELLRRLDQAWGTAHELILPEHIHESIHAVWNSEEPLSKRETLEFVQQGLLEQTLARLQPLRIGVRELQCHFTGPVDSLTLTLRLVQPTVDRRHLWDLLRLEWERQERSFHKSNLPAPRCMTEGVTSIRLEITVTAPLRVRQQTLFDLEPDQKQAQAFRQFVERVSSRLGSQSVLRSSRVADPQPECACEYAAWEETASNVAVAEVDPWEMSLARSRPLRLLRTPALLRVLSPVSTNPPDWVWWSTQQLRFIRHWGPERIETGWWREQDVQRDYYRVETTQGLHFWIFQCLQTGQWFLHGTYE